MSACRARAGFPPCHSTDGRVRDGSGVGRARAAPRRGVHRRGGAPGASCRCRRPCIRPRLRGGVHGVHRRGRDPGRRLVGHRRVGASASFAASRLVRCEPVRGRSCPRPWPPARGRNADRERRVARARCPRDRAVRYRWSRLVRARPVRNERRSPAVGYWHVGSESDGGVAGWPRVAGRRVASGANGLSESWRAG